VSVTFTHSSVIKLRGTPVYLFSDYDRLFLYRYCKRNGLSFVVSGNNKAAVTHLGRHITGSDIQQTSKNIEITKNALGHVSAKSTENYIRIK